MHYHPQLRLYQDLAWLFPIITPPEDYVSEAEEFVQAIRKHSRIDAQTLLNLGCGAGHNDHWLQRSFQVTGIDCSPQMLTLARGLNPALTYLEGDMRTVRLGMTFDAVMVADSISYMLTEDDLRKTFETAFTHLKEGGVFCTYAEETKERFQQNMTTFTTHSRDDLEVTLIENDYDPNPDDTTFEMTFLYLIRRAGQLSIEADQHLIGLFPLDTWERLLKEVGFQVEQEYFDQGDCPFFVGIKPDYVIL